MSDEIS